MASNQYGRLAVVFQTWPWENFWLVHGDWINEQKWLPPTKMADQLCLFEHAVLTLFVWWPKCYFFFYINFTGCNQIKFLLWVGDLNVQMNPTGHEWQTKTTDCKAKRRTFSAFASACRLSQTFSWVCLWENQNPCCRVNVALRASFCRDCPSQGVDPWHRRDLDGGHVQRRFARAVLFALALIRRFGPWWMAKRRLYYA